MDKFASSPFRKGSFDLLQLLSLQEAIHRTLRQYMSQGESKEVSFQFLREFYIERVSSHFDGYQQYGRGDDFLEELLLTAPSVRTSDSYMELIDPHSIACDVIETRSKVLVDWKEEMMNVPKDHIDLKKVILSRQMESGWGNDGGDVGSSTPEPVHIPVQGEWE